MSEKEKKPIISQEDILKLLDACYEKCLHGIPKVSPSVEDLANDYLKKYDTREEACKAMLRNQIAKCATSGFITGFGGFITVPVAIPANISSVLYVQMRMIACAAHMAGFELKSDQTRTFIYACLAGVAINELLKQAGIKLGMKVANGLIVRIPGKVLTKINQKVGTRLVTKFGTKGIVNLGKLVPAVGAVIGGGLDYAETKIIANRAYKWFFEGNFIEDEKGGNKKKLEVVDVELEEILEEAEEELAVEESVTEEVSSEEEASEEKKAEKSATEETATEKVESEEAAPEEN